MTRYAVVPTPLDLAVGPDGVHAVTNNAWTTANAVRAAAFQVRRPVTVTAAWFRVITQNGNMDVGIYDAAGVLLASTGGFAMPAAANNLSQALSAPVLLLPGRRYYAAMASDSTTAVVLSMAVNGGQIVTGAPPRFVLATTSYPLPASLTITEGVTVFMPSLRFA